MEGAGRLGDGGGVQEITVWMVVDRSEVVTVASG